ncbi:g9911 [Coccomyxa viridis]|uniref:G9911 protein n=1 Tax=Coccomyxa viridis TaxID=1274662 RepID=A0ABP1GA92_9CHLO
MPFSTRAARAEQWKPSCTFELQAAEEPAMARRGRRNSSSRHFASATASMSEGVMSKPQVSFSPPPPKPKVDTKPASDIIAGAVARAASQGTIHPLDTLKVRMQAQGGLKGPLSKIGKLVPPAGAKDAGRVARRVWPGVASLYKGVVGAASGAGIYIGTYFAFYGTACNLLSTHSNMSPGGIAFVAGGIAAAGGSVVKVPLAVCIRSVQAGVYPNVFHAARSITDAAGVRGLFTGYLPNLLEDVPDMAFKFAAYESMRSLHRRLNNGRSANVQEDFCMGATAGAFAAAATTPLDVIKTNMMCTAASRPTMMSSARAVLAQGGPVHFFRGVGPRALSNGINSAVFFCFFEALRGSFKKRKALMEKRAAQAGQGGVQSTVQLVRASPQRAALRLAEEHVALELASMSIRFKPLARSQALLRRG